ncbi:Forkhead transcription factor required for pathogenic development, partial [Pseudozyma hubeiensis]
VSKPNDSLKALAADSAMRFPPLSSEREKSRQSELSWTIKQQSSERPDSRPMTFLHVGNDPLTRVLPGSDSRSMSRWFRSQHFQAVWERLDSGSSETRPPHPYTELIKLCILKRREGKLTLNQLYRDLEEKFPFFAMSQNGKGWRPYFIKLDRERGQLGKGHYWAYCPDLEKPTSLAQCSVVQLSSLWPPSISASSVVPRLECAHELCSATASSDAPNIAASVTALPRFEDLASRRNLEELLRNRYASSPRSARIDKSAFVPPVSMRRLSSPAGSFHHTEEPVASSR